MNDTTVINAVVPSEGQVPAAHKENVKILNPDVSMVLLTWITFFSLLAILHKFAWKPILKALDDRAEGIRKSLENADKANKELADINQNRERILAEAHQKAQEIIEQSRKQSLELAKMIQEKAKQENQIVFENSKREIEAEKQRAKYELRKDSADLVVKLVAKIVGEGLDKEKSRKIVDQLIENA